MDGSLNILLKSICKVNAILLKTLELKSLSVKNKYSST